MALGIYKQGQGYWTRMMTFLGGMVMFAWGGAWLFGQIRGMRFEVADGARNPGELYGGAAFIGLLVIGAMFSYWIAYAKPKTSEFFIATEGEMRKVNWSSRREVMGSTWVVIGLSVFLALVLFVVDVFFSRIFQWVGVLESGR